MYFLEATRCLCNSIRKLFRVYEICFHVNRLEIIILAAGLKEKRQFVTKKQDLRFAFENFFVVKMLVFLNKIFKSKQLLYPVLK